MNKLIILGGVILVVSLIGIGIIKATPKPEHTKEETSATLAGPTWVWEKTGMSDGAITEPKNKGAFTLKFLENNVVEITTDCNSGSGSYSVEGTTLTIGEIMSTQMYCENSQESEFMRQLGMVQSYLIKDEKLHLLFKYDSGTMTYSQ